MTAASTWLPEDAKPTSAVTMAIRMHAPSVILTSQAGGAGRASRPVEAQSQSPPTGTSSRPTRPSAQAIADSGTASGSCPPGRNGRNVATTDDDHDDASPNHRPLALHEVRIYPYGLEPSTSSKALPCQRNSARTALVQELAQSPL